jgi:hypothetical protein
MRQGHASTVSPVTEVIAFFSRGPSRAEIAHFRLSEAAQERLRILQDRNAAGTGTGALTPEETDELDRMVLLDDIVSLIRIHAHAHGEHKE